MAEAPIERFKTRVQLFTGKGGVGKSTLTAAVALALRERGLRPLIVELGHRASMETILGKGPIGHRPVEVSPGVFASNVDPRLAVDEFIRDQIPVKALVSRVLRSRTLDRFFAAAPAVTEVATLHYLEKLANLRRPDGSPTYSTILVDLDATGHALMFLGLPAVFHNIADQGPLRTLLDRTTALLTDPLRTHLHLVTLPTELAVEETMQLYRALSPRRSSLPARATKLASVDAPVQLGHVVLNQMPESPFMHALPQEAGPIGIAPSETTEGRDTLHVRAHRRFQNATHLKQRLEAELGVNCLEIPELDYAPVGEQLNLLRDHLLGRSMPRTRTLSEAPASGAHFSAKDLDHEPALDQLIQSNRLVVCVGPGGVGKTTTAAALALRASRQGLKVLVLTIDPARRLADALGLDGLDDAIHRVPAEGNGALYAAMLDTKRSYDSLIKRIARDERSRRQIFDNRVYQAFSKTLARSHAYVAMERLYDVVEDGDFDLVVLDTPPTRSALDILDAPGRLSGFLQGRVVRWFLKPSSGLGAGRAIIELLGLVIGDTVVEHLVSFFDALSHLRLGFETRANRVKAILEESTTAFVLVTAPETTSLSDARYLREGLRGRGIRLQAVVFNRAYQTEPGTREPVKATSIAHGGTTSRRSKVVLKNDRLFRAMREFLKATAPERVILVPELENDVRSVKGLEQFWQRTHEASRPPLQKPGAQQIGPVKAKPPEPKGTLEYDRLAAPTRRDKPEPS
ncbi:MAG: ArsA family ATPase [Myxococcota bacterium]